MAVLIRYLGNNESKIICGRKFTKESPTHVVSNEESNKFKIYDDVILTPIVKEDIVPVETKKENKAFIEKASRKKKLTTGVISPKNLINKTE